MCGFRLFSRMPGGLQTAPPSAGNHQVYLQPGDSLHATAGVNPECGAASLWPEQRRVPRAPRHRRIRAHKSGHRQAGLPPSMREARGRRPRPRGKHGAAASGLLQGSTGLYCLHPESLTCKGAHLWGSTACSVAELISFCVAPYLIVDPIHEPHLRSSAGGGSAGQRQTRGSATRLLPTVSIRQQQFPVGRQRIRLQK